VLEVELTTGLTAGVPATTVPAVAVLVNSKATVGVGITNDGSCGRIELDSVVGMLGCNGGMFS
jgi:hypothetical protein